MALVSCGEKDGIPSADDLKLYEEAYAAAQSAVEKKLGFDAHFADIADPTQYTDDSGVIIKGGLVEIQWIPTSNAAVVDGSYSGAGQQGRFSVMLTNRDNAGWKVMEDDTSNVKILPERRP